MELSAADEHKQALRKIVDLFNTGDLSEVPSIFSAAYVDHQRPPELDATGPDEFGEIVTRARAALRHLHVRIDALLAEGDLAAARLLWHLTTLDGEIVERETLDVLRFANGQVVEHWGAESWRADPVPQHGNSIGAVQPTEHAP